MSNDYLELRKAASRTTKFAREQARGQAAVVTTPLLEKPFGTAPVRVERMKGGPNAFGPVETTTVDALAPLNFAAEELSTPAAAGGMLTRAPALTGRALNAVVENVPTYLDRFYERSPLGQAYVFGKEALGAVPQATKQMLSPQAAANARVKGTGERRIKEFQQA